MNGYNRMSKCPDGHVLRDVNYMINAKQQQKAANDFAKRWKDRGYEKGESNLFWIDLLTNVYGVDNIAEFYPEEAKNKSIWSEFEFAGFSEWKNTRVLYYIWQ